MTDVRYVDCPDCLRRFDMRDEDNWARLLDHDCKPPEAEHCGHVGTEQWAVTYRWSIRRTYTVTAATATEALDLAAAEWANDDGADMAGEPDAFTIPNHAPDDVEVSPS